MALADDELTVGKNHARNGKLIDITMRKVNILLSMAEDADCSLTELTQENYVSEVIAPNEHDIPLTEDNEGPPNLINTEGTHEQNVQNEQITTQPTEGPS
nr:retrovirus-related Pol polyprotein from transposon TNT 1-94 [Tanacetum cinerariifolium]